jgi:hypothetical protein
MGAWGILGLYPAGDTARRGEMSVSVLQLAVCHPCGNAHLRPSWHSVADKAVGAAVTGAGFSASFLIPARGRNRPESVPLCHSLAKQGGGSPLRLRLRWLLCPVAAVCRVPKRAAAPGEPAAIDAVRRTGRPSEPVTLRLATRYPGRRWGTARVVGCRNCRKGDDSLAPHGFAVRAW